MCKAIPESERLKQVWQKNMFSIFHFQSSFLCLTLTNLLACKHFRTLWLFPRISAHTLISALPRISAHPLGHNIKQARPFPPPSPSSLGRKEEYLSRPNRARGIRQSPYHWRGWHGGWRDNRYFMNMHTDTSVCKVYNETTVCLITNHCFNKQKALILTLRLRG